MISDRSKWTDRERQKGNNREKCASAIKRAKFLKYHRAKGVSK
jgi:hypothetical protein